MSTIKEQCEKRKKMPKGKEHWDYKHGMHGTRPYSIWWSMITRCYSSSSASYKRYGALGVIVCEDWKNFEGFWNDMKDTYFEGATIDRVDNTKGYSKDNCRWATIKEQARNKKSVKLYNFKGEKLVSSEIDERLGFKKGTFRGRIRRGWSFEDAISKPPHTTLSY